MSSNFMTTQAYFDCNATTPVLPSAAEAALETMRSLYGNPSSSHLVGIQAKFILESSRKAAAKVVGSDPDQIIFTSGATEAIQTAVFSALQHFRTHQLNKKYKLLYGATEHKAVPQALHHWVKALNLPYEVKSLPVDSRGQIQMDVLRSELKDAALLCTMAVNNETGIIQNLNAIESVLNETQSNALWLVDCVQALGKIDLNLQSRRIDYAPFSGHKLYAPKGIGFLYVKKGSPLFPLIVGGGQEKGLRSGTENLPGVAAFGAVLKLLFDRNGNSVFQSHQRLEEFRNQLIQELQKAFPKIEFNMPLDCSVPTTINFSVPGFKSEELLDVFDSAGLRLSAGSACSAQSAQPSYVLDAMGIPQWRSVSAIRLSFGPLTQEEEIVKGCSIIRECALVLKNTCLLATTTRFEAPANLRDGVIQFRVGPTNTWILANRESRNCIIIDPCDGAAERIEQYVKCQNLTILAILDTHSHADHDSIRPTLQKILEDRVSILSKTSDSLGWPDVQGSDGSHIVQVELENKIQIPALLIHSTPSGDFVLGRLHSPGHTTDSHTYLYGTSIQGKLKKENILFVFCGDTILTGGLGRTNFSVSDPKALYYSLQELQAVIDQNSLLCPAHDYNNSFATTLKTETQENSLLALALQPTTPLSLQLFLQKKKDIDLQLCKLEENFQGIVCGTTLNNPILDDARIMLPAGQLSSTLESRKAQPLIIDIREAQEFHLFKEWEAIGLQSPPRNVPLSRLVNFIGELLKTKDFQQEIVFICRTGRRSLFVAKSLRRIGFNRVYSLEGGVVLSDNHATALKIN